MSQQQEDHLPHFAVRPRFKIETSFTKEEIADKIKAALAKDNTACKGQIKDGYCSLFIPEERQHYWSPQLTLTLEETEKGCMLRGVYGPRSTVWTMFVFIYAVISFAVMIVSIIGLSRLSLDKSITILWLVPVLIMLVLSFYLVAFLGQKFGHDQMMTLHHFVEKSTGLIIDEAHEYKP